VRNTFSGRAWSQNQSELSGFIQLLKAEGVRVYGEVGARHGDTFYAVMTEADVWRGAALDLPGGLWGQSKSLASLLNAAETLNFKGRQSFVVLGNSQAEHTRNQFLAHGPFGCILIDGDHTLEGVTADWQNFRQHAPLIAFHDIVGTGQREKAQGCEVEVPILWQQIKAQGYRTKEFVGEGSKMGIGVVWTTNNGV